MTWCQNGYVNTIQNMFARAGTVVDGSHLVYCNSGGAYLQHVVRAVLLVLSPAVTCRAGKRNRVGAGNHSACRYCSTRPAVRGQGNGHRLRGSARQPIDAKIHAERRVLDCSTGLHILSTNCLLGSDLEGAISRQRSFTQLPEFVQQHRLHFWTQRRLRHLWKHLQQPRNSRGVRVCYVCVETIHFLSLSARKGLGVRVWRLSQGRSLPRSTILHKRRASQECGEPHHALPITQVTQQ